MKQKLLLSFFLFLMAAGGFAQSGSITVTSVQQRSDGSGLVDVYFNLSGPSSAYNIYMQASFDGGITYSQIPPAFLSGDMAGITPGGNKHIVWDGLGSFPNTFSTQARLELTATEVTGGGTPCPGMPTFTDSRDGQTYNTVQIGSQCWMKENLKYLPSVVGPGMGSNTVPYYYVYGYNGTNVNAAKATANYQNYGALYNWPASLTACPPGWHLPSDAEWTQLTNYVVSQGYPNNWNDPNGAGNALKSCRQVNSPLGGDCNTSEHPRWNSHSTHHGFDEFGFSAFPGGHRDANGSFGYIGYHGYWWSSTEDSSTGALSRHMYYYYGYVDRRGNFKSSGFSVRCLRDLEPETHQLILEVYPAGAGTVTGQGQYEAGEPVNITAEANPGWEFVNWTDDDGIVSEAANFTYTMPAGDITLTANFVEEQVGFTCGDSFTDPRDGQTYNTVQIGDQCWMAENLKYLPSVVGPGTGSNTVPYYYVYGYNGTNVSAAKATANYQNYGALYNWPASLNACPPGWHVPSDAEWTQLTNYVVSQGYPNNWNDPNGTGNALKSCRQVNSPLGGNCNTTEHPRWNSDGTHHGFDEFGFSAFPGGDRGTDGTFGGLGSNGYWWSSTEGSSTGAWGRYMGYDYGNVGRLNLSKSDGFSVRCLRD